ETIYSQLPIALQNLLISGQGLIFRRQRFSRNFQMELEAAIERSRWPAPRIEEWQIKKARAFFAHAAETSPYWQARFADTDFDPANLRDIEDIRRVPVLEKEDLRKHADKIASSTYRQNQ